MKFEGATEFMKLQAAWEQATASVKAILAGAEEWGRVMAERVARIEREQEEARMSSEVAQIIEDIVRSESSDEGDKADAPGDNARAGSEVEDGEEKRKGARVTTDGQVSTPASPPLPRG
jgi:hypothetical protein